MVCVLNSFQRAIRVFWSWYLVLTHWSRSKIIYLFSFVILAFSTFFGECHQWRSQTKIVGGVCDFKRATVFCLGHRLSKHKITRYTKNLWNHGLLGPTVATAMNGTSVLRPWMVPAAPINACLRQSSWPLSRRMGSHRKIFPIWPTYRFPIPRLIALHGWIDQPALKNTTLSIAWAPSNVTTAEARVDLRVICFFCLRVGLQARGPYHKGQLKEHKGSKVISHNASQDRY